VCCNPGSVPSALVQKKSYPPTGTDPVDPSNAKSRAIAQSVFVANISQAPESLACAVNATLSQLTVTGCGTGTGTDWTVGAAVGVTTRSTADTPESATGGSPLWQIALA
jgi:hypothetical protein